MMSAIWRNRDRLFKKKLRNRNIFTEESERVYNCDNLS